MDIILKDCYIVHSIDEKEEDFDELLDTYGDDYLALEGGEVEGLFIFKFNIFDKHKINFRYNARNDSLRLFTHKFKETLPNIDEVVKKGLVLLIRNWGKEAFEVEDEEIFY